MLPFVVLSDAAPRTSAPESGDEDPLEALRTLVRYSREDEDVEEAGPPEEGGFAADREPPPLWPAGLAIQLAITLAAAGLTVRRLRVPARRLAPGERVA